MWLLLICVLAQGLVMGETRETLREERLAQLKEVKERLEAILKAGDTERFLELTTSDCSSPFLWDGNEANILQLRTEVREMKGRLYCRLFNTECLRTLYPQAENMISVKGILQIDASAETDFSYVGGIGGEPVDDLASVRIFWKNGPEAYDWTKYPAFDFCFIGGEWRIYRLNEFD